jgi:hypothetical protein
MDRWLKLKRKNTEDVNEAASCSKQSDLIKKTTKCRKYISRSACYVTNYCKMKPSKLRRHLESKRKQRATKSIEFLKNKEQEIRQSRKLIKEIATGSCNENAVKASYEVSMLIAKAGKPHTIAE